jgi:hypothetical protein
MFGGDEMGRQCPRGPISEQSEWLIQKQIRRCGDGVGGKESEKYQEKMNIITGADGGLGE